MPEHTTNSWPSDHYSVVTDFEVTPNVLYYETKYICRKNNRLVLPPILSIVLTLHALVSNAIFIAFQDIPFYEAPSQPMKRVDPHFISVSTAWEMINNIIKCSETLRYYFREVHLVNHSSIR